MATSPMQADRYILSLWPLDDEGEFLSPEPAWESEVLELPEAEAAHRELTHAVAWAILGEFHAQVNASLDVLDADGLGICQQIRTLHYA